MAVAFDAATAGGETTGTSLTFSHTCTGSDRRLYVGAVGDVTNDTITGITYGGTSMVLSDKQLIPANRFHYLFRLNAPASGANDVVISSSSSVLLHGRAFSYTGVNQADAPDASTKNTGTGVTTLTTTLTTVADNCWLVMSSSNKGDADATAGTDTTERDGDAPRVEHGVFDSNAAKTPPGSFSLIANSASSTNISSIMESIAPAAAVAPKRLMTMFAGS